MRVLVVEDDTDMAESLKTSLVGDDHDVEWASDGETGENMAMSGGYDVIVLDRMLPKKQGVSIVRELRDDDLPRLARVRACPVQFQERLEGLDVRVHVVGSEIFATAAYSASADYRYAVQDGLAARLAPYELNDDLAQRCLQLTSGLGLLFSGIDLKLAPDGRAYCFEVNCCPGYSYFEANTGQPIALALARLLAGQTDGR